MIDLHCHLLPGIDDGPAEMEVSLQLAQQAVADGVVYSVVTPHVHHGRWENTIPGINNALHGFKKALISAEIPLSTSMAAEVRLGPEIMAMLQEEQIPFLGGWKGYKVMLLEMPHSHILPGTDKLVEWLLNRNVLPMIAHPERNKDILRKFNKIEPLIELGCLFQVTAGSLVGQFGEKAQYRAEQLLDIGVVTVLASDAHNPKTRPVNLSVGYDAACDWFGMQEADKLVKTNPMTILRGGLSKKNGK